MAMVEKKSLSREVFQVFNIILMVLIAFICFIPIWHVLMASVSDPGLVDRSNGLILFPLGSFSLNGYRYVLSYKNVWIGYRNTLLYVVAQCLITGVLTVIAGYILSRKRFRFRKILMGLITFTMLFNGGMIPTYMVVRDLHMLDTRWAMLIPSALNVFFIIIMRTSIQEIPDSLEESATIDGAGELTVMFKIILPLVKATFAVIMLFIAVAKWNEWFPALLYLSDNDLYPLQMFLRDILIKQTDFTSSSDALDSTQLYKVLVKYCVIVVSTLPVLCIYPFVQKYFVTGVMIGSVKG